MAGELLVYGFILLYILLSPSSLALSLSIFLSHSLCRCFLRHGFAAIIKWHKEGKQEKMKPKAQHTRSSKMKSKTKSHIRYERAQHKCQVLTIPPPHPRSLS